MQKLVHWKQLLNVNPINNSACYMVTRAVSL